jgi:hypothetical protein
VCNIQAVPTAVTAAAAAAAAACLADANVHEYHSLYAVPRPQGDAEINACRLATGTIGVTDRWVLIGIQHSPPLLEFLFRSTLRVLVKCKM